MFYSADLLSVFSPSRCSNWTPYFVGVTSFAVHLGSIFSDTRSFSGVKAELIPRINMEVNLVHFQPLPQDREYSIFVIHEYRIRS